MPATYKRIIEERLVHEIFSGDYFVKDHATEGTTRILISEFIDLVLADSATEEDLETVVHNFVPEYDSATSYSVGNYCIYLNELYRCTTATTGDFDENDWTSVDVMGELVRLVNNEAYYRSMSDIVLSEDIAEPYDTTKSYVVGDLVAYQLYVYRCTGATTGTWDSSKWTRVNLADELKAEATARQNMDNQLASGISKQMTNLADFYDTTKSYVIGDVVMQQSGDLLRCIAPTSGTFDNTKWEQVTVDELFDDLNFSAEAISYDNTSSGLEAENVQDAIDEVVADVDAVETALETKAEQNGVYDDLVAGNLLSDSYTADNAPYLYRQSPSASSVEQNIVGGTVAWNQLADSKSYTSGSITITVDSDNAMVVNGTTESNRYVYLSNNVSTEINHIYYLTKRNTNTYLTLYNDGGGISISSETEKIAKATAEKSVILRVSSGYTYTNEKVYPQVIDLTQAFGSTIADYIYSLEQATAGSGIAWLKANGFLTKNYYPYDSGSLQSVKTSGRKIVGKNLFDKATNVLNGYMTSDGTFKASNSGEKTFYCKVPKGTITMGKPAGTSVLRGVLFDSIPSNNDVGYEVLQYESNAKQTFTTTKETYYVCYCYNNTGESNTWQSVLDSIQVEVGSTATAYEPYNSTTYPSSPIDLRGIPKLDSNNQLYFDGDVYESDGSVKRKYGIVDLSSLTWSHASPNRSISNAIANTIKKPATQTSLANLLTSNFYTQVPSNTSLNTNGQFAISQSGDMIFYYDGVNEPKGYMVYELATPTSETADAYENPQLVGSTEEFIDTRDVPIPVGGERKYHTDLKAKLEELAKIPDVPSTNGTYKLIATRSASGVTYAWVSD